jgi:two-component system, NarL family, response regulator NreC
VKNGEGGTNVLDCHGRLLLLDEQHIFRHGLRSLITADGGLTVVGEAADARAATRIASELQPDLVIMDSILPDTTCESAIFELRRVCPSVHILALARTAAAGVVKRALAAGARGYALKQEPIATILSAIRRVAGGGSYLEDSVARLIGLDPSAPLPSLFAYRGPLERLSLREREIFDLLARGLTNEDAAARLFISVKTVETHRARIFRKLELHSLVDLLRFALENDEKVTS